MSQGVGWQCSLPPSPASPGFRGFALSLPSASLKAWPLMCPDFSGVQEDSHGETESEAKSRETLLNARQGQLVLLCVEPTVDSLPPLRPHAWALEVFNPLPQNQAEGSLGLLSQLPGT